MADGCFVQLIIWFDDYLVLGWTSVQLIIWKPYPVEYVDPLGFGGTDFEGTSLLMIAWKLCAIGTTGFLELRTADPFCCVYYLVLDWEWWARLELARQGTSLHIWWLYSYSQQRHVATAS